MEEKKSGVLVMLKMAVAPSLVLTSVVLFISTIVVQSSTETYARDWVKQALTAEMPKQLGSVIEPCSRGCSTSVCMTSCLKMMLIPSKKSMDEFMTTYVEQGKRNRQHVIDNCTAACSTAGCRYHCVEAFTTLSKEMIAKFITDHVENVSYCANAYQEEIAQVKVEEDKEKKQ